VHISQVVFLFLAYLCLASNKHTKLRISLFKFFPYFPDAKVCLSSPGHNSLLPPALFSYPLAFPGALLAPVFSPDMGLHSELRYIVPNFRFPFPDSLPSSLNLTHHLFIFHCHSFSPPRLDSRAEITCFVPSRHIKSAPSQHQRFSAVRQAPQGPP
jgi:hypothetical protein